MTKTNLLGDMGAVFSPCMVYRYKLWRGDAKNDPLVVIGLNPSTADEKQDDPTIRRCMGYAIRWGHSGFVMLNLFAVRSTDPSVLGPNGTMCLPHGLVGPANDEWIAAETEGRKVLCAWGVHGALHDRDKAVVKLIKARETICLKKTKDGHPIHPLYQPSAAVPIPYP